MQIMDENEKWLYQHCFEYDDVANVWVRDKEPFIVRLYARRMDRQWLMSVRFEVNGKRYVCSNLLNGINDEEFEIFIKRYTYELKKQPFGYLASYYINFENGVIS